MLLERLSPGAMLVTVEDDEEATHIDLPLKSVDFSPLVKTVKGFTNRWEYAGSLTTPPCSEVVKWIVMKSPIQLSKEQIKTFTSIIKGNNRPVQPLYHRIAVTDAVAEQVVTPITEKPAEQIVTR